MARVERGNVVLHVADNEIPYYLSLGYSHTDDNGDVIESAIPTNIGELRLHYVESDAKIKELETTIAELKAELEKPKTTRAKRAKDSE